MKKISLIIINLIYVYSLFAFEMVEIPQIKYTRKDKDSNFQLVNIDSFYMAKDDVSLEEWGIYLDESLTSNSEWKPKYAEVDFSINDLLEEIKFDSSSFGTIDTSSMNVDIKWPVCKISFLEAVKYCNYLSEKECLELCYEISTNEYGTEKIIWNKDADGYRLPTLAEWQAVSELYSNKIDRAYLRKTNICDFYSNMKLKDLIPNTYGVVNILSNVGKFLWDYENKDKIDFSSSLDNPTGPETFTPSEEAIYYNDPIYEVRLCSNPFYVNATRIDEFLKNQYVGMEIYYPEYFTIRLCRSKK